MLAIPEIDRIKHLVEEKYELAYTMARENTDEPAVPSVWLSNMVQWVMGINNDTDPIIPVINYIIKKYEVSMGTQFKPILNMNKIDTNANIFEIIGTVRYILRQYEMFEEVKELTDRVMDARSYDEAKEICFSYVTITNVSEADFEV